MCEFASRCNARNGPHFPEGAKVITLSAHTQRALKRNATHATHATPHAAHITPTRNARKTARKTAHYHTQRTLHYLQHTHTMQTSFISKRSVIDGECMTHTDTHTLPTKIIQALTQFHGILACPPKSMQISD